MPEYSSVEVPKQLGVLRKRYWSVTPYLRGQRTPALPRGGERSVSVGRWGPSNPGADSRGTEWLVTLSPHPYLGRATYPFPSAHLSQCLPS